MKIAKGIISSPSSKLINNSLYPEEYLQTFVNRLMSYLFLTITLDYSAIIADQYQFLRI